MLAAARGNHLQAARLFSRSDDPIIDCQNQGKVEKEVIPSECEALKAFYQATGGPDWKFQGDWLSTNPICEDWTGVSCFQVSLAGFHVTGLDLHDNNLTGRLPGDTLLEFPELAILKLSQNALEGPIPMQIGQLKHLHDLILDNNKLTGPIPKELADVPDLTNLSLNGNQLDGAIPERLLGHCAECNAQKKYGFLRVVGNNLTGALPDDIGRTQVTTLDFRLNKRLSGPIPDQYAIISEISFFGYLGTDVCKPDDPSIEAWLDQIQTVLGSGLDCIQEYSISGLFSMPAALRRSIPCR